MLASAGYPASSSAGDVDRGARGGRRPRAEVTARGHGRERDGEIVTAGGRVLNVTALGEDPRPPATPPMLPPT